MCKEKHNTLLHDNGQTNKQIALNSFQSASIVLLSTARVKILGKNGSLHIARALLDNGSQSTFITASLCNKLQLVTRNFKLEIAGLNQTNSTCNKTCNLELYSNREKFRGKLSCFVIDTITDELPNKELNKASLKIPNNIELADPDFNKPSKIDILIGADLFWSLIGKGRILLGQNGPTLQETTLGWIVTGPIDNFQRGKTHCNFNKNSDIQKQLSSGK